MSNIPGVDFVSTLHHDTYPAISKSDHSGTYVLITGASKGIGRATALSFARAGAKGIAIGARSSLASVEQEIVKAARGAGEPVPQVVTLALDVSNPKSVDEAVQVVSSFFPHLDILINNAGVAYPWTRITDFNPDNWWDTWEVNIRGTFLVSRAVIPLMTRASSSLKTIVNMSSMAATIAGPGSSAYGVSKLALVQFGEILSNEYAHAGLLVYAVNPGAIPTELALNTPEAFHPMLIDTLELAADTMTCLTQTRQKWLAGRFISCNWDMEELMSRKKEIVKKDLLKAGIKWP